MKRIAVIEPQFDGRSANATNPLRIGVIGCGRWGKNYIRNFSSLGSSVVNAVCDCDHGKLIPLNGLKTETKVFDSYERLFASGLCDAVVVSSIASTHYSITKSALQAGLDVLVEKPLALSLEQADELVHLSSSHNRILMVAHTFLFNHGIRTIKKYIQEGRCGEIFYVKARRTHLGPIREDVNVIWDLAPHEIAILLYLLDEMPSSIQILSRKCLHPDREDVAFVNLVFPSKTIASLTLSWLDPHRERYLDIVGSKARIVFDDLSSQPIQIFPAGILVNGEQHPHFGERPPSVREAHVINPKIPREEPMKVLCQEFLQAIATGTRPLSDGQFAREVIALLCRIQSAMHGAD